MQPPNIHTAQSSYTDLNRLQRLKVGDERDSEANLRQVAQEFEALFIGEMMKAMRSANDVLADDLFNSNESKTYRDMYDQQMSVTLSQGKGMGMADVLVRQMSSMQQPSTRPNPFAQADSELKVASEPAAATPATPAVESAPAAAENTAYRHVADTSTVNFRRYTGVAPSALAKYKQQLAAASAETAAGQQPTHKQAMRSYADVINSLPASAAKQVQQGRFHSPEEFVTAMLPMAEQAAKQLGVDPSYLVAQAALETGWGKHMQRGADGQSSYNLFGIKAHGWKGQSAAAPTSEYINGKLVKITDSFRQYDSFTHSFNDYVNFLQQNPRYKKALQVAGNAEQYVRELQRAGYATDPNYAAKISRIARQIQQQSVLVAQGPGITERT